MRNLRTIRLLAIAGFAVPLLLCTVLPTGSAWARGKNRPAVCRQLMGTGGVEIDLSGCTQEAITGTQGSIPLPPGQDFPDSPATITWSFGPNRSLPPLQTTIRFRVIFFLNRKNTCGAGNTEYKLMGVTAGNSAIPGIAGKVKVLYCDTGGVLTDVSPTSVRF